METLFDQDSIAEPEQTVRNAIYVSIVSATLLYVMVAIVTTDLVPASTIQRQPDTALAIAARPFFGSICFVLIAVAALFSTGSALNATLFGAARLSKQMIDDNFLPNDFAAARVANRPACWWFLGYSLRHSRF